MLYTKEVPYIYARDSIYYFNRRIPKDLQSHFRRRKVASGIAPHGNYLFPAKVLGVRSIEIRHLLANV